MQVEAPGLRERYQVLQRVPLVSANTSATSGQLPPSTAPGVILKTCPVLVSRDGPHSVHDSFDCGVGSCVQGTRAWICEGWLVFVDGGMDSFQRGRQRGLGCSHQRPLPNSVWPLVIEKRHPACSGTKGQNSAIVELSRVIEVLPFLSDRCSIPVNSRFEKMCATTNPL